jgi:hypothetical protein
MNSSFELKNGMVVLRKTKAGDYIELYIQRDAAKLGELKCIDLTSGFMYDSLNYREGDPISQTSISQYEYLFNLMDTVKECQQNNS